MICPSCKCEYIRGITQCADCGVPLVQALEPEDANSLDNVRLISVWQGNDPAECERVKAALDNARIGFLDRDSKNFDLFVPSGSNLEIFVSTADREAARKIILDEDGSIDPYELTPVGIESLTLPESDQPDSDEPQDLSVEWHEDDPTVAVWMGKSDVPADNLVMCLREVGIASRKLSEPGRWQVVVRPEQESRAREIVREVVEASPPE
ncbi:MAG TPA: hypothetical protein VGT24_01995 [Candidatus Acidoferrales bacterium]|nr:hypothetical protein [Candidatus Acidoferrales bacterium]